jgi:starch synthase
MKGGLIYADYISTVSKTYAKEIQYEYFGEHLDGLLRSRNDRLFGIVNGIDYNVYNPMTDPNIFETYDVSSQDRKADNKTELQNLLGLPANRRTPMVTLVSRLVPPKGLILLCA